MCLYCRLYDVYSFWYVVVLAGVCLRFAFGVLVFLFCGVGVLLLVCRLYDVYFFRYVAVLVVVCLCFSFVCRLSGYYMMCTLFCMPPFWVLYVCVLLLVCRRFAGYMMSTVFGVSLFFFLVCLCCSLYGAYFFGMSAFSRWL